MELGGVTIKEVIVFQTQVMMGAQFGRVKAHREKDDLLIACLRMGWNDAFRHTSENVMISEKKSVIDERNAAHKGAPEYDDAICCEILNQTVLLNTFKAYATAKTTEDKVTVVQDRFEELQDLFGTYKKLDGDRAFCFGHIQKMFNIALKLYLCLYVCREYLELDGCFDEEILGGLPYADCPVDSIILKDLSDKTNDKCYKGFVWSKFGTKKQAIEDYTRTQRAISGENGNVGKSNLYYDFARWKNSEPQE